MRLWGHGSMHVSICAQIHGHLIVQDFYLDCFSLFARAEGRCSKLYFVAA